MTGRAKFVSKWSRNAKPVIQLKQTLDWVVKKWGYEYILVAGGALLGLLIVVIVGFDDRPRPPPAASTIAAPHPVVRTVDHVVPDLCEKPQVTGRRGARCGS